jgi:uncharacterized CHY-type Zn-finger protein
MNHGSALLAYLRNKMCKRSSTATAYEKWLLCASCKVILTYYEYDQYDDKCQSCAWKEVKINE